MTHTTLNYPTVDAYRKDFGGCSGGAAAHHSHAQAEAQAQEDESTIKRLLKKQ